MYVYIAYMYMSPNLDLLTVWLSSSAGSLIVSRWDFSTPSLRFNPGISLQFNPGINNTI